jgi:hypothetical protein
MPTLTKIIHQPLTRKRCTNSKEKNNKISNKDAFIKTWSSKKCVLQCKKAFSELKKYKMP